MGFGCIAIYPKLFVTFFAPFYGQSQHIYYISQIQGAHSLPAAAAATASRRIIQPYTAHPQRSASHFLAMKKIKAAAKGAFKMFASCFADDIK